MVIISLIPSKRVDKEKISYPEKKITEILGYKAVVRKEQIDLAKCREKRGSIMCRRLPSCFKKRADENGHIKY